MKQDELFQQALAEFAKKEKFQLIINENPRTKQVQGYILRKESFTVGFTTFLDKQGKFNVIKSKALTKEPEAIAQFTLEELNDKKLVIATIKAKLLT